MITEKKIRDLFEEWTGYHLTIHRGGIEQSYRVINTVMEPINGVIEVDSWSYTPIRTVAMASTSATVTIIARTDEDARDTQEQLNDALAQIRGTSFPVQDDEEGKTVLLSVMAGTAYRPEAVHGSLYGQGDEYDVVVRLEFIATANGISSADTSLYIDGEQVEIESITSSMVCATEDHPGDDGITTTATPTRAFQIEANAVLLDNSVGKTLLREALSLSDSKTVRCIEYRVHNVPRWYMMVFTRCQLASSELNNVGASFSLMSASIDAMEFDARWSKTVAIGDNITLGADVGAIIFWGDNTSDVVGETGMISHVYTDGITEHQIRIFGGYDAPLTRSLRIGDNLIGKRLVYVGDDWDVSGEPDATLISCEQSVLAIASGYMRELRDDGVTMITIGDHILKGTEWRSTLDVVTGIRDESLWHVYVEEMGV